MKTVLIPIHDGTITKNLLRTDFLRILKESPNVRVVLLLNTADPKSYQEEFGVDEKVIIEHARVYKQNDFVELIFSSIFKHSIPTEFMKIRQVDWYKNNGNFFLYYSTSTLRFLGRFKLWRKIIRSINHLEPIDADVKSIYKKWSPDMVFAPTMISRVEVALMRLARREHRVVVGMVKSFDNLTSKAFLRVLPDRLIVPNATCAKEAAHLYDLEKEKIFVTGICQYDAYVHGEIFEQKELFFKSLGLDPKKKTILYAPAGDWMNPTDHEVLEQILKWTKDGTLPNTQVLLRLHPTYESKTELLKGYSNLVIERPGSHYGHLKWYEFDRRDVSHLASSLAYADVVINTGSTLMVEAAIFDTPVIALGFDGHTKKDYWHSVIKYYDREHLVPVMDSHGVKLVKSFIELQSAISAYFKDRSLDREGRKKVVEAVCYKIDGESCKRTASVIIDALNNTAK